MFVQKNFTSLLPLALAALAACGLSEKAKQAGGSCVTAGGSRCVEYAETLTPEAYRVACETSLTIGGQTIPGGAYAAGACAAENLVGSCRKPAASEEVVSTHYYSVGSTPYDAIAAQANCVAMTGNYTAAPARAQRP